MDSLKVKLTDAGDGSTSVELTIDGGKSIYLNNDIPHDGHIILWLDGDGRERVEEEYDGMGTNRYFRTAEGKIEEESTFEPYINRSEDDDEA